MRRRGESDLLYRRSQSYRQDYRLAQANFFCRTTSTSQSPSARTSDGSRGKEELFLRTSVAAFCSFEGGVYLIADFFAYFVVFVFCLILDLIFFSVICSLQDVSWRKLRKIVRDLWWAQKRNSVYDDVMSIMASDILHSRKTAMRDIWTGLINMLRERKSIKE